jgi:hypothetical protein
VAVREDLKHQVRATVEDAAAQVRNATTLAEVADVLQRIADIEPNITDDTVLVSLLQDVCQAAVYKLRDEA